MTWTCACGTVHPPRMRVCDTCGTTRGAASSPEPTLESCSGCGSGIDGRGYCRAGGGFSGHLHRQPAVCPACRRPLRWSGACYDCRSFPGEEYEWEKGHWVLARKGPGRAATLDEIRGALTAIGMQLEGMAGLGALGPLAPLLLPALVGMKSREGPGLTERPAASVDPPPHA